MSSSQVLNWFCSAEHFRSVNILISELFLNTNEKGFFFLFSNPETVVSIMDQPFMVLSLEPRWCLKPFISKIHLRHRTSNTISISSHGGEISMKSLCLVRNFMVKKTSNTPKNNGTHRTKRMHTQCINTNAYTSLTIYHTKQKNVNRLVLYTEIF